MKYVNLIARILLGLVFVVFGANKFYMFIHGPMPTGMPLQYFMILMQSHIIYVVGALEVIGGLLLLLNRHVALGLTLLGPVLVNILLYDLLLDTSGLSIGGVITILYIIVLWHHKAAFGPMLAKNS